MPIDVTSIFLSFILLACYTVCRLSDDPRYLLACFFLLIITAGLLDNSPGSGSK